MRSEEKLGNFDPVTQQPIAECTFSIGKCIANIAQWHVIELLKVATMPLRVGNYYLIKAQALNEIFRKLDKKSIEQYKSKYKTFNGE